LSGEEEIRWWVGRSLRICKLMNKLRWERGFGKCVKKQVGNENFASVPLEYDKLEVNAILNLYLY
jgi:hypothetical protein